jgi:TM2 domain-containing membrane protein YozV
MFMRLCFIVVAVATVITSCSSKYTASFQSYDRNYGYRLPADEQIDLKSIQRRADLSQEKQNQPAMNKELIASIETNPILIEPKVIERNIPIDIKIYHNQNKHTYKQAKNEFRDSVKEIKKQTAAQAGGKSQVAAVLLAFFLGGLGIHRFYLGYTVIGIIQLLTLGGLGIWALIDFIRIIIGDLKPKGGEYEKTL